MRPLSAHDLVRVWERGQERSGLDRAALLLSAALPESPPEEAAGLSVGCRDALLLRLREQLFGPALDGFSVCPQCESHLEFTLDSSALYNLEPPRASSFRLSSEGYELSFRLPTTSDMHAAVESGEVDRGRALLLERCVTEAFNGGMPVAVESLPDSITAVLAERMAEYDPNAETLLDLSCPMCGNQWQVVLDIATFLWMEIAGLARRLLREVHVLARAYGWREADILGMSAARRQLYMEMAG